MLRRRCAGLVAVVVVAVATACGASHPKAESTSSTEEFAVTSTVPLTIPETTTSAPALAVLGITPPSGVAGASFTFRVTGLKPAETITFEIRFPDGSVHTGPKHKASPTGSFVAPYQSSASGAAGTYAVHVAGDQGTTADAAFTLAAAPTTSTTAKRRTSSTSTTVRHTTATTARTSTTRS